MSTTVTYKNEEIATVDNDTVTLLTEGTWMEDDVTLTDVSGGGGSTVYSGTYMSATRPSANVAFSCPGATHFVIRVANNETPDLTLGVGFSVFAYVDTTYTTSIGSNNNGSNTSSSTWRYNTGWRDNYFIGFQFTAGGVEAIYYDHNYYKWFQAGLTYSWYAW